MSIPLITQTIALLPAAPDPATDDAPTFSTKAAAMVLGQKAMVPEMNTYATQANALAAGVDAAATIAQASAQDAVQASGVTAWVSGTTYTAGQQRYSLINFRTYRRTTNGAGTTDPSLDAANWTTPVQLGMIGYVVADNPAVPTTWTCPNGVKLVEYELQDPGFSSGTSTTVGGAGGRAGNAGKGSFVPTEGVTYTLTPGQPAAPAAAGTNTSPQAGTASTISGSGLTTITSANARVKMGGGIYSSQTGLTAASMMSPYGGSGPGAGASGVSQSAAGAAGGIGTIILRY